MWRPTVLPAKSPRAFRRARHFRHPCPLALRLAFHDAPSSHREELFSSASTNAIWMRRIGPLAAPHSPLSSVRPDGALPTLGSCSGSSYVILQEPPRSANISTIGNTDIDAIATVRDEQNAPASAISPSRARTIMLGQYDACLRSGTDPCSSVY